MGSCPEICCSKNVKVVNDYPVQITNNIENKDYNNYLTQPNYSSLIFLQTRLKRFLNNKSYNSKMNLATNLYNQNNNKNSLNQVYLQKESTNNINTNFRQQTTDKEEYYENQNNQNRIDLIEEQKLYFPKIMLNKGVNIFQKNIFSKPDINNNKDPRNGPFDGKKRKYQKIIQDDFSYEGEWKDGKREGFGILIKKDIAEFIGEFIDDKVNGFGKVIYENGDEYIGYWKDSQAYGLGIYNKKNIISYQGWWKKDKQNGFGIEKWPKLDYFGEYLNGNKEGYGVLNIRDGIYEGEMKEGNINGVGCFIFKDKRKYEGEFVNNKIEGYGILSWPDGKIFVGSFKDDLQNGFGVFYTSKKIYIGVWQNMLLEGEVIVIEGDKRKKQLWEQGKCYKNLSQNYEIYFEKYVNDIIKQKELYIE
jgi:hypothetical protein